MPSDRVAVIGRRIGSLRQGCNMTINKKVTVFFAVLFSAVLFSAVLCNEGSGTSNFPTATPDSSLNSDVHHNIRQQDSAKIDPAHSSLTSTNRQHSTANQSKAIIDPQDDHLRFSHPRPRQDHRLLARFYSNDPVGFAPTNPIMFNRYAYANNNPYKYIDPDGRSSKRKEEVFANLGVAIAEMSGLLTTEQAGGMRVGISNG